ncbi:unnamed protein product [Periconia digitata]|uniref:NAD(P)-binding protein n=1 Tax=Periconia digitata TaxID=1303443 RepID=A0A9W4XQY3_9PLEO|nr:unnamed protein product [Periconia digitata]
MPDQTKYTTKLSNARVLIIGGTSGLGYGLAEALLESNATIALASSTPSRLSSAKASLLASYPSKASNISTFTVDLSQPATLDAQLSSLFESAVKEIGGDEGMLDHVVYTAGDALFMTSIEDLDIDKVIAAGSLRFFAPLMAAKYVQRYVRKDAASSYTITSGAVGEKPNKNWSVVASYAGGQHAMIRNLAVDLKPVRVNGVAPGAVDTEMWKMGEEAKKKMFEGIGAGLLTGRVGRVEDVVESYLAVLKDGNMVGTMIRSDGGHTIV